VKYLLRMSLLIIARAGLCMAVVAWIVGQWCELNATIPTSPHVSRRPKSSGRIGANGGSRGLSVDWTPVVGEVTVFLSDSNGKAQRSWDASLEMNVRT